MTTGADPLLAGLIDARLVIALANLASEQPIDIVQFGNVGPGAGGDMPLRFADLATTDRATDLSSSDHRTPFVGDNCCNRTRRASPLARAVAAS